METTKLSSKGQIIIPKAIRDSHNWQPGQEFAVIDLEDGIMLQVKKPFPPTTLHEVAGSLKYDGASKTLDDMEKAIEKGIKEMWAEGTEDDCD
ncbi:MAG: AbrB/MazE/SpoVT family DNA-binding domain-containing protein [Ardenticatenaceae bacterium]|nr:AbrB/MazE/SpoVT family DNA-binding domain-containing protein [Ardenticatenaceae bacterium]